MTAPGRKPSSDYMRDPRKQVLSLRSVAHELRESARRKLSLASLLESVALGIEQAPRTYEEASQAERARLPRAADAHKSKPSAAAPAPPQAAQPTDPSQEIPPS